MNEGAAVTRRLIDGHLEGGSGRVTDLPTAARRRPNSFSRPCASSSIPNQRNLRMSMTSSLDAFCLAEVSEGCRLRGVSTLVLLVLCATGLTTAAPFYADLSAPNIVYFLDLLSKAVQHAVQNSAEYLRFTASRPRCALTAPSSTALAYR